MISPRKTVTLADVAKAANVSKTTASHALSGRGYVSPATREIVLQTASEMGFSVDPLARLLSHGRCEKTIGFYTLDLDLSGRTRQMQNIHALLSDRGYSVPIFAYGYRGRDDLNVQIELAGNLLAQRPAAIVCNTAGVRPQVFEKFARFAGEGGVVVCYGYENWAPIECDQLLYAEGDSFALATRYLLESGHRELGLFSVGHRKPSGEVLRAFREVLDLFGADLHNEWLFQNDGTQRYEQMGEALAHEFLALENRPTGMIVANDYAATAFISTLSSHGVRVPQDLSVIGHDNDAIAPFGVVPLSSVTAPIEEIGEAVVEMLQSRMLQGYSGSPRRIVQQSQLVLRASTAPKV